MSPLAAPVSPARATAPGWFATALDVPDEDLAHRLNTRLADAEQRLRACPAEAPTPLAAGIAGHLIAAGGKRLRPVLALLGAEFGPRRDEDAPVRVAVVAELIHVASLYHDDVIDGARTRHGVASVNARWGSPLAVLTGDWLLARAAGMAAELSSGAVEAQAAALNRLIRGQVREAAGPPSGTDPIAHHFSVIADKTAALISLALRSGAEQAGSPPEVLRALSTYAEHLGTAFQLADDLLDITAEHRASGKDPGADLAAGVPTLPVLLALANTGPRTAELRELLTGGDKSEHTRTRTLHLLRTAPTTGQARQILRERVLLARGALVALPPIPARQALDSLCDLVARRPA